MYKSELKTHPTLINHAIKEYEFPRGPLGPIGVLALSKSNFEIDLTSHYKESTTLQYPMYITAIDQVLESMDYPLHANFL